MGGWSLSLEVRCNSSLDFEPHRHSGGIMWRLIGRWWMGAHLCDTPGPRGQGCVRSDEILRDRSMTAVISQRKVCIPCSAVQVHAYG